MFTLIVAITSVELLIAQFCTKLARWVNLPWASPFNTQVDQKWYFALLRPSGLGSRRWSIFQEYQNQINFGFFWIVITWSIIICINNTPGGLKIFLLDISEEQIWFTNFEGITCFYWGCNPSFHLLMLILQSL